MSDQTNPVAPEAPVKTASEIYPPSTEVIARAHVKDWHAMHEYAVRHPDQFWADHADELGWYQPWDTVLDDTNKPFFKWFTGGRTNIVHNAIDRHLRTHRKNKLALIWEGEDGSERTFSYFALNREVSKFANVLKALGVQEGRPGHHLHGPRPRAAVRHAGLRQDRRDPLGGLRRLLGRGAARPHRRRAESRCWSPATAASCAARSSSSKKIVDEALQRTRRPWRRDRRASAPATTVEWRRPRPLVARPDGPADRQRQVRDRADGRRGPAVHPLHLRHHRQAQGHRAHPRRLHGGHLHHLRSMSSTSRTRTATGARPTRAGSPATPTSSTRR